MAELSVGGRRIAYDIAGDGPDLLLLVHGHPFNRSMWGPQLAALQAPGWRMLAPDLRGYGASEPDGSKTRLEAFAADLVAVVDQLGIDRFVAVGLSMGGQIAMEICRSFPGRVAGLGLAATSARPETPEGVRRRLDTARLIEAEGMGPQAEELLPKMLSPGTRASRPDIARHVLDMMRTTPPAGAAAALRGRAERPSYEPVLQAFAGPALVVAGDEDPFTTREDTAAMHAQLGDCELVWLQGCGHMPNLERPDEFNGAVMRLLKRVENDLPERRLTAGVGGTRLVR